MSQAFSPQRRQAKNSLSSTCDCLKKEGHSLDSHNGLYSQSTSYSRLSLLKITRFDYLFGIVLDEAAAPCDRQPCEPPCNPWSLIGTDVGTGTETLTLHVGAT
jgi:hypothetical protein